MLSAFLVSALSLLLLGSATAAEIPLSAPVLTAAPGPHFNPRIASDGTNFLVVWDDARQTDGPLAVWAMRVDAAGHALDPTGVRVTPPDETAVRGAGVVWTGESYLVAWNVNSAVETRRLDRDGRLLDAKPRRVMDGTLGSGVELAHNALFTTAFSNSIDVWAVDAAGELVNVDSINQGPLTVDTNPVLASSGSAAVIAWRHWDGTRAWVAVASVSSRGDVGARRLIDAQFPLAIAANGSDFLVVYQDNSGALIAERVDSSGASIARNALPYTSSFVPFGVSAGPYGDGYVVVAPALPTQTPRLLPPVGMRLDRDGRYAGALAFPDSVVAFPSLAAFATNGSVTLAAWSDLRVGPGQTDVFARIVGAPGDDTLLSRAAIVQRSVVIAPGVDGGPFLAAWLEMRGSAQLRAGRFTRGGAALDGDGIVLGEAFPYGAAVAAAFDGVNWIVAWMTPSSLVQASIAYVRIAPDGRLLDPTPRTIDVTAAPAAGLAMSSNGAATLVVFTAYNLPGVRGVLIPHDGVAAGFPERISWDADPDAHPAVAWNGSLWLVAWERTRPLVFPFPPIGAPPPQPSHDIHAARVTPTLQVLDPVPIVVSDAIGEQARPSVASDGRDFVVAWHGSSPTGFAVFARRVGPDAVLGDRVSFGPGTLPSVTARRGDYVVGWIAGSNFAVAPLANPSLPRLLAIGADALSTVMLAGDLAAYDRVDTDPRSGSVPRGFVQEYGLALRKRAAH